MLDHRAFRRFGGVAMIKPVFCSRSFAEPVQQELHAVSCNAQTKALALTIVASCIVKSMDLVHREDRHSVDVLNASSCGIKSHSPMFRLLLLGSTLTSWKQALSQDDQHLKTAKNFLGYFRQLSQSTES